MERAQQAAADLDADCDMLFSQERPLDAFIDSYPSEWHLTSPEQVLDARLKQIETGLGEGCRDAESLVMMSTLVGALVLARSAEDPQLARRIMDVVRESLKTQNPEDKKADQ